MLLTISFFISSFLITTPVFAICPVCVAATGGMLATARLFGVDDLITGTFVGGLIVSVAAWVNRLLVKRNKGRNYLPFQSVVLTVFLLLLFITISFIVRLISFALFDRILIGTLTGVFITSIALKLNDFLRENNGNKNYVLFQHILVIITFLLITVFGYYIVGVIR